MGYLIAVFFCCAALIVNSFVPPLQGGDPLLPYRGFRGLNPWLISFTPFGVTLLQGLMQTVCKKGDIVLL